MEFGRPIIRAPDEALKGVTASLLNVDADAGAVQVELLNAAGYRIPGYTKAEEVPIKADGLRQSVEWKDADLSALPDGEVIIRTHLQERRPAKQKGGIPTSLLR